MTLKKTVSLVFLSYLLLNYFESFLALAFKKKKKRIQYVIFVNSDTSKPETCNWVSFYPFRHHHVSFGSSEIGMQKPNTLLH